MADREAPVSLCGVRASSLGDCRHGVSGHAKAVADVVSSHVVGYEPEERCECRWIAADAGTRKLSNGLELAAQVTAGNGTAGTRSFAGIGRSR